MGAAIYDYYKKGKASKLRVFSPDFDEDEIPVAELFREYDQMSEIEKTALQMADGDILDVGAGSGCHSLALRSIGKNSVAIDISTLSVEVMRERGLDARLINFFDTSFNEGFDTILMLMNGSGIVGTVDNMGIFFSRLDKLLKPGGKVLMDSSDLRYLYEDEDGGFSINLADDYFGQMVYRMKYKAVEGEQFNWLYVDPDTLSYYASQYGYRAEVVCRGEHYDYLAQITKVL
jgi:2-polyprenyl-3-methyl-5-hydroxy-6-metoxy-1,4-benzoquinol methylase